MTYRLMEIYNKNKEFQTTFNNYESAEQCFNAISKSAKSVILFDANNNIIKRHTNQKKSFGKRQV